MSLLSPLCETQVDAGPLVLTQPIANVQSVAIGIFFDVGSRDETAEVAGIAHALEHMLFKGTAKMDVHTLSEKLDQLGGSANAFTSKERTCFHMHVLHEDWPEALAILLDMVRTPAIPDAEWQREREVIYSEMAMVEDSPEEWVSDQHTQFLFPDHTMGWPTLGTPESLADISREDLCHYLESHYQPPRMLIAAAGRIDHQALVDQVADQTWGEADAKEKRTVPEMAEGTQWLPRDMEQAQIICSWQGLKSGSDERPLMWLANQMLGGGMSSRLFREVREKRGLAYGVGSYISTFSDVGLWSIGCGTNPEQISPCIDVIRDTVATFADVGFDKEEFERCKRQLTVQIRMGIDHVEGNMLRLSSRFDEPIVSTQQQWLDRIAAINGDRLHAWLADNLSRSPVWTICGSDKALAAAQ
ncbi:MAG: pitrilysin family protein [Mariprofundaceae bacterium]